MSAGNETVQKAKINTTRCFYLRLIIVFVVQPYLTFDLIANIDFSKKKIFYNFFSLIREDQLSKIIYFYPHRWVIMPNRIDQKNYAITFYKSHIF